MYTKQRPWHFSAPGLLGQAEEMFQDVLEHCREALGVGAPGDFPMGFDGYKFKWDLNHQTWGFHIDKNHHEWI